jgi:hypothetical protein
LDNNEHKKEGKSDKKKKNENVSLADENFC